MLFNLILCDPGPFKQEFFYLSHEVSFFPQDDAKTGIFCHYILTGAVLLQSTSLLLCPNFYTFLLLHNSL